MGQSDFSAKIKHPTNQLSATADLVPTLMTSHTAWQILLGAMPLL